MSLFGPFLIPSEKAQSLPNMSTVYIENGENPYRKQGEHPMTL